MAVTSVYVDGFNLYHGAKELVAKSDPAVSWKWLDVRALAARLAPRDQIHEVRYFTAHVTALEHDPDLPQRQQTYLRALATLVSTTVHLGQFKHRKNRMVLVRRPSRAGLVLLRLAGQRPKVHPDGSVTVRVWRTEEKGSDVNLASYLLADAFKGSIQKAVVISNDTDLCEPIRLVRQELGIPVLVVNPRGHTQPAAALQKVATETRRLRVSALTASQFPTTLNDQYGTITKPAGW